MKSNILMQEIKCACGMCVFFTSSIFCNTTLKTYGHKVIWHETVQSSKSHSLHLKKIKNNFVVLKNTFKSHADLTQSSGLEIEQIILYSSFFIKKNQTESSVLIFCIFIERHHRVFQTRRLPLQHRYYVKNRACVCSVDSADRFKFKTVSINYQAIPA